MGIARPRVLCSAAMHAVAMGRVWLAVTMSCAAIGCGYSRSPAESAQLAQRKIWTQQAANNVVMASTTPGGLLDIVVADSTGSAPGGQRWFLDIATGRPIWKGEFASRLIADAPNPIVAEQRAGTVIVSSLTMAGVPLWSRPLPGFALASAVRVAQDLAVLVTADGNPSSEPVSRTLTLTVLRAHDGTPVSITPLGWTVLDTSNPSAVELQAGVAVAVAGDLLASVDMAQGKVVSSLKMTWSRTYKPGLPMGVFWRWLPGGELVAAVGSGVVAVATTGMLAWPAPVIMPGYIHDLTSFQDLVVCGFRDPETHDSGVELVGMRGETKVIPGAPRSEEASYVNGLSISSTDVFWISRGHLVRANLVTGQVSLSNEVQGTLVHEAPAFLLSRASHLVLLAPHGVQALSADARAIWTVDGFATPREVIGGLVASAASDTQYAALSHWNPGPGVYGGPLASFPDRSVFTFAGALTKGQALVRDSEPRKYASFVYAVDATKLIRGVEANLALVDLDSGARMEYPLVAGNTACTVGALLHEPTMIAIEGVEAFGLACGRGNELYGIRAAP